jgi:hypothetical protein
MISTPFAGNYIENPMRAQAIVSLLVILSFLSGLILEAGALSVSNVSFRGAGVAIDLEFPEEAHPIETITHNLTITALTSLVLENFTLVMEVLVNMSWQQVYKEQIFSLSMQQNEGLIRRMMFTLPQNAHETLYCYMYVLTDKASSEPSTNTFYTTHVRTMTYNELLSGYDELLANYSSLRANWETLLGSYNTLSIQYGTLNSTYTSLLNQYNSLQATFESLNSSYFSQKANYDALKASYDSLEASYKTLNQTYHALKAENDDLGNTISAPDTELTMTRNLVYAFIAVTVALVALVIYIKKKKPEPYIVIRKETVALEPT